MMARLANTTSTRQVLHICGPSGWTWAGYRSIIIIILLYILVAYTYNFERVCHISLVVVVVVVLYVRMLSSVCWKCIHNRKWWKFFLFGPSTYRPRGKLSVRDHHDTWPARATGFCPLFFFYKNNTKMCIYYTVTYIGQDITSRIIMIPTATGITLASISPFSHQIIVRSTRII